MSNYDERMDIFPPFLNYPNKQFKDIFTSSEDFKDNIPESYSKYLVDVDLDLVYSLLMSKYRESTIAYEDEDTFKANLYRVLFQFGPTWAKKLDIQDKLRGLSEAELIKGASAINSHAYNPSTVVDEDNPGPNPEYGEITTINEQTNTKYKKSKLDAYASLIELLNTDVTDAFLNKFKKLFVTVICPFPRWDD